jgi:hypothetical protein
MSDCLLEVKITKATLFLTEDELLRSLPPDVLAAALQRGKHILRSRRARQRETPPAATSATRTRF